LPAEDKDFQVFSPATDLWAFHPKTGRKPMYALVKRQPTEPETEESDKPDIAKRFEANGFTRFNLEELDFPPWLKAAFEVFAQEACSNLKEDPYEADSGRNRAYGTYIHIPGGNVLQVSQHHYDPVRGRYFIYYQRKGDQKDFGGIRRKLPALTQKQLESPVLHRLIEASFRLAKQAGALPDTDAYKVGVHFIQLEGRRGKISGVTPSGLHVDGEPVTVCFLMGVENIKGGWNAITGRQHIGRHPDDLDSAEIWARFSMDTVGQGYIVNDGMVAHHAENVELDDPLMPGHRTVLLIDFCPASFRRADDYKGLTNKQLEELFN
jgi:hypothetical protein